MKKYGFTLAEVLIALGIIGVVASLTAPTFVSNIRNTAYAARLSATVSTLENAFTTMIAKEDVDTEDLLFDTDAWRNHAGNRNAFAGDLGNYITLTGFRHHGLSAIAYYGANNGPYIMNTNGSKNPAVNNDLSSNMTSAIDSEITSHILELKNGATIFLMTNRNENPTDARIDTVKNAGGSLYNMAARLYIDVNGVSAPNTFGRDIFEFYLGHNGKLYPLGGRDAAIYDSAGAPNGRMWNEAGSAIRCMDGNIMRGGEGCAARVIEEDYKINY